MGAESEKSDSVKVVVRVRPFNEKEIKDGHKFITQVDSRNNSISLINPNPKSEIDAKRTFTFDATFDEKSTQVEVYSSVARPIVESCIEGYNGTIFAYGQTGTGKTFTMEGIRDVPEMRGIIPNSFAHIFGFIAKADTSTRFLVRASYMEIYMEEIRDLLSKNSKQRLALKENPDVGVYVKDLLTFVVKSADEIERIMSIGNKNRSVGATNMNEHSSRSHAIFSVVIERSDKGIDQKEHIRVGKLNLVDLAGSERQSKTGSSGERLKEAAKINMSLSTLGNVISALVDGKSSHIPYRDSKLTRLLQDSLGGNAKTVMIANIGPASYNFDESLNTLRYANRTKNIKNKPRINEDPKDALLREFQNEIEKLKRQLEEGISAEGNDGEEDEDGTQPHGQATKSLRKGIDATDEKIKKMQEILDQEKRKIEQDTNMAQEEKNKIQFELEERENALEQTRKERNDLNEKLKNIQEKLLVGGVNLLHKAQEQEKMLEKASKELLARTKKEQKLQKEITKKQVERQEIEEEYATLQEEAISKTEKLKRWWAQYMEAKGEIEDMQNEFQREREELLDNIRQLSIEIKLKILVIDHFIPFEYQEMIENSAFWSPEIEEWQLNHIAHAGNNLQKMKTIEESNQPSTTNSKMGTPFDLNNIYLSYDEFTGTKTAGSISDRKPSARPKSSRGTRPSSTRRRSSANGKSSENNLLLNESSNSGKLLESSFTEHSSALGENQFPSARNLVTRKKHFA